MVASAASPATPDQGPLVDTFGRVHTNLRVSVTDQCNLRCTYCMPEDVQFLNRREILSFEEISRLVRVATGLGIDRVRLTGGEPTLRKDLWQLVEMLAALPGLTEITLTSNGILLAEQLPDLIRAGLSRVTISLDTLDPGRFFTLARRTGLDRVIRSIHAARDRGLIVKLNAVVLRGVNDGDIIPLARFARSSGCTLRFIESMPIGADSWDREQAVLAGEILATIAREFGPLRPVVGSAHAPAQEFAYSDGVGRIGVIASVSRPFCRQCNRLRLTADGRLRNCLFALDEFDVRPLLRAGSDADIGRLLRSVVWAKGEGHEINSERFIKPARTMHAIGG
jgi:cyclic pyranopterin phosphate synthase